MPNRSECIQTYLRAKDENRPHLMKSAFADMAKLETKVETDAISFPPVTNGIDEITKVLVRNFGQAYENVYTFCLTDPPKGNGGNYSCPWLVGMSEKSSGSVRVGCGYYDWSFQNDDPHLVDKLAITVKTMEILPSDYLPPVMNWLAGLPYPWCLGPEAIKGMPNFAEFEGIRKFVHLTRALAR